MSSDQAPPAEPAADLEPQLPEPGRWAVPRSQRAAMPRKAVRYSGPSRHAQALVHDCAALLTLAQRRNRTPAEDALLERLARGIRHRGQAFVKSKREWDRKRSRPEAVAARKSARDAREAALRADNALLRRLVEVRTLRIFSRPEAVELLRRT